MISAHELRQGITRDTSRFDEILKDLEDKLIRWRDWGDDSMHFGMENDQEFSDKVIDILTEKGYNAHWNDCLLAVYISWEG